MKTRTLLLVAIAVAALAGLVIKAELDKRTLTEGYAKAQSTIRQLEDDWIRLNQELSEARQEVEAQSTDLAHLRGDYTELQERLVKAEEDVAAMRDDYAKLQHANTSLTGQLAIVSTEKAKLEAKLSSVKELKVALRDLRQKIWHERWEAFVTRLKTRGEEDQVAQGNRGFVVRHGSSTLGTVTRLQVRVLDPETP